MRPADKLQLKAVTIPPLVGPARFKQLFNERLQIVKGVTLVGAVAVASFLLVALFVGVARFLILHLNNFEARATERAAAEAAAEEAASAEKEAGGAREHLQRVTPVIVIQPGQEVRCRLTSIQKVIRISARFVMHMRPAVLHLERSSFF